MATDDAIIAEATAKLNAAVGELAPTIDQSFLNTMYAIAAKTDDLSTQDMENVLVMLEEIESTGRLAGKLKALDRRRRRNSDVKEAVDAIVHRVFEIAFDCCRQLGHGSSVEPRGFLAPLIPTSGKPVAAASQPDVTELSY